MSKEEIQRNNSQKKQAMLILLCWFMYVASYVARYSYNANITAISAAFHIKNYSETGLVTTCFFFAYGIGQVINGLLCKRYNKRTVLFLAVLLSALINLCVFLGVDFSFYKYLWLLNGAALSTLWCSLILTLSENLETKRLKTAILVMGTTVPSGTLIAYGASALFNTFNAWKITFLLATVIMLAAGIVWIVGYKKLVYTKEKQSVSDNEIQTSLDNSKGMSKFSLWTTLIALAIFAIVCNLIKDGLMTWVPSILKSRYGFNDSLSIVLTLSLPIIGFIGVILVSQLRKKVDNFVILAGILYIAVLAALIGVLFSFDLRVWLPLLACFSLAYCFMSGVNNIVTASAPLYLRGNVNSGLLAGLLDGFCYLGSTISSYGLGAFADAFGWEKVFILLIVCAAFATLISLLFMIISNKRKFLKQDSHSIK